VKVSFYDFEEEEKRVKKRAFGKLEAQRAHDPPSSSLLPLQVQKGK